MDTTANQELEIDTLSDNSGMFGHPRGLSMLFFTEFWERYSGIAVGLLISAGLLALLTPKVKKLMGTVN